MIQEGEIAPANYRFAAIRSKFDLLWTIASYAATQVVVQLLTLVTGFLIIRALPKEQYAVYILASAGLGILTALSDSGISAATMSLIGTGHRDTNVVTRYYLAARRLRWTLFAAATLTIVPLFVRLAWTNDTSLWTAALCCVIVLAAGMCQLNYALSTIVPKLRQTVRPLQRIALVANGLRLPIVIGIALVLPNPVLFLLTNLLSALLLARLSHTLNAQYLAPDVTASADEVKEIWRRTYPQIPNSVFYCFFGQASLIIIAILGQDAQVAEVGALGRLSVLFAVATSTMATVIVPRFSRIANPKLLLSRYVQTIAAQAGLSAAFLLIAVLFPHLLLLILGESYAGLEHVVKWSVLAALIHSLSGTVWHLNASKGWVRHAWITIPVIIIGQIIIGLTYDLSTVEGAVLFGSLPMIPSMLFLMFNGFRHLRWMTACKNVAQSSA